LIAAITPLCESLSIVSPVDYRVKDLQHLPELKRLGMEKPARKAAAEGKKNLQKLTAR
jgi:hypothetical protein